jgi:uncharacterized protein
MFTDLTRIPVIDAHMHVFPEPLARALRQWFETYAWKLHDQGTAEELVRRQFDNGAAGLVLMGYAHRAGVAGAVNETVGGLVRKFPNTAGLAAIHPGDPNPRDLLRRAREEFGLRGVKMHCHVMRVAPDDPILFPIYEAVLEFDGIVNIHAGREPAIEAYGADVRSLCGAARVEQVLRRYPGLKMIIPHLGFDETAAFCSLLERYPNLYLDTTMIMGGFFHVPIERDLIVRHADRILYGTDYPHIPYDLETEVRAMVAMDLGDGCLRQLLCGNAARLFGLRVDGRG